MARFINKKVSIAIFGVTAVSIFIISILITAKYSHSFKDWYTTNEYFHWHTMAISHFGVSNLAIPFTIVVCLSSLLIIYFIVGTKRIYGNEGLLKRGASWIITGYVALMLAFLFLLYEPNSTLSISIHFIVAIVYFVSIPIGILLAGMYFLRKGKKFLGYTSLLLGTIALISGPIVCVGSSILLHNKGVAIPEFIQIIAEDIWIILVSIDVIRMKDNKLTQKEA